MGGGERGQITLVSIIFEIKSMRDGHVKNPQSLCDRCFAEFGGFMQAFSDQFFQKLPIAKMEKSGYYECGFRLVNSIFGSRCHGTEMKVNGV